MTQQTRASGSSSKIWCGLLTAVAAGATTLVGASAWACGGFFCNTGAPVDQTGEQILFIVDGGSVEAQVQVQYQGPSEDFAWIVPTPSLPEVGVSSATVFQRLALLAPQFRLNWQYLGDCMYPPMSEEDGDFLAGGGDPSTDEGTNGGVQVIAQAQAGPYDYAILRATDTATLFEWLQTNDYDIPDNVAPYVDPYVQMGEDIHFVAFKLQKGTDAGDIQPITLRYEADNPTIPIQLTAVAVQPDMPLVAYVLGQSRAVPDNYLHVEINEARVDWLSGGANYREVVSAAMDEAGGKAFVTDFAGSTSILNDMFFVEGRVDLEALAAATDPRAFFNLLQSQGFSGDSAMLGLFEQFLPLPEALAATGVQPRDYYNCLDCYAEYLPANFDAAGFAEAIESTIVGPLRHVEEVVDRLPYVTRLYSSLSAAEMTLDPSFVQNPELPDVSNVHTATAIVDCRAGGEYWTAPVTLRLEDGRSMVIDRASGIAPYDALPAANSIAETSASGAPAVVTDNTEQIDVSLASISRTVEQSIEVRQSGLTFEEEKGCSASKTSANPAVLSLVLLSLVAVRRRRN